ncbi:nitroreductase family protein [Streptomyces chrestomyceticus]|uniref:nitroreductase family protein n=1 Tax=Streptomyces chrestomyceticus TaxID=68185 RepID=UPI0035A8AEDC
MAQKVTPDASCPPVPGLTSGQFLRVLTTRSATRLYTDAPVTTGVREALVEGMLAAPSAGNAQAWAFLILDRPRAVRRVRSFAPGVLGVPAMMVVACADHTRGPDDPREQEVRRLCVAMAVQNLLLTAHAYGLGACPVHSFRPAPLRHLLDLPSRLEPVLLVPIGYPAYERRPSLRRGQEEVISYRA